MKIKRILAAMISVVTAGGCMAYMPHTEVFNQMTVEAAYVEVNDNCRLYYTSYIDYSQKDYVRITGCSVDELVTEIEIPSEIDGYPVEEIGEIGDSYNGYGDTVFGKCANLKSVIIPDTVTTIGDYAFEGCESLETITIPDSVTEMGDAVFSDCTALKEVVLSNNLTCLSQNTVTLWSGLIAYDRSGVFEGCTTLTDITIPNNVKSIGKNTFSDTAILNIQTGPVYYVDTWVIDCNTTETTVEFKDGIKGIGDFAFDELENLESVIIPDGVTSIGWRAFWGCNRMQWVTIPATVEKIGSNALGYTSSGEKIANFTIYGTPGTVAEDYALKYGFTFVDVEDAPDSVVTARPAGDANDDGKLTVSDAAFIARTLAKRETIDVETNPYADYNKDGKVSVSDAAAIARMLAKAKTE